MAVHSGHPQSIKLQHCWVCKEPFIEYGGSAQREIHHIIPQAYGGVNGPTVDLCDTHHSCLHKLAVAVRNRKPYEHIFGTDNPEFRKKLTWLAQQVNNAQALTLGDPNKKLEITIPVNKKMKAQLEELGKIYPHRGRAAIMKLALDHLYRSHFLK